VRDATKKKILELVLEIRKVRKTIGTYIGAGVYSDGRYRTSYRILLETGRTSTSVCKPPITTESLGLAFQTITKHGDVGSDLRSLFIPDKDKIFIESDLSQAEARVVAILARDEKLLKMFDYEVDIHRVTECWLRDKKIPLLDLFFSELCTIKCKQIAQELNSQMKGIVNDDERQEGKKFRHAGHYDMGKREASIQIGIAEAKAAIALNKFHSTNPNIRDCFHREIVDFLNRNNRILTNPFGRQRQFLNKWGSELWKEAYAQIPQSTVSDQVKFAAIRIERRAPWIEILQESHDSLLAQIPENREQEAREIMREELEQPIDFSQCSLPRGLLVIPCDIKVSKTNWMEMH
jgi:DNA polymerase I-like protein with 3'-5' exonuclease and polymerase domains